MENNYFQMIVRILIVLENLEMEMLENILLLSRIRLKFKIICKTSNL